MNWLKKIDTVPRLKLAVAAVQSGFRIARGLFPMTWMSVLIAAFIYYVWFWEVSAHANQILFAAVLLWVFAFCIFLLFTIAGASLVFFMTRKKNKGISFEEANEVGGRLASPYRIFYPFFMPFISTEIELLNTSFERRNARKGVWAGETLHPTGRGRFSQLSRKVTVRDIFGMTEISFTLSQPVSLVIQPAKGQFELISLQTRASGDGYSHPEGDPRGELVEMRRYQAGDPLRLVLWKVFARSRKLVVRAPEPAIVEEQDVFVYFISGDQDENSATLARSFLSSLGREESKDMYFAADGARRLVSDEHEGMSDLIDSAAHRSEGGQGLNEIAPLVKPSAMAHCFILVPNKPGPWVEQIKIFIEQYHIEPTFITSVSDKFMNSAKQERGTLKRILFNQPKPDLEISDYHALCKTLSGFGTVEIVDVTTGASKVYTGESA
ncbi:MAG: DUF58 domain-containing protein [Proteobacteria bacterium]|nr:DUF58 domain-containing protein [Pseudomonadota bacterium]